VAVAKRALEAISPERLDSIPRPYTRPLLCGRVEQERDEASEDRSAAAPHRVGGDRNEAPDAMGLLRVNQHDAIRVLGERGCQQQVTENHGRGEVHRFRRTGWARKMPPI